jgi:hypothetical protein
MAALAGVLDDVDGWTLRQGDVESGQDELGPEMRFHRQFDHASVRRVEHDGEIQKAGPRRHVG